LECLACACCVVAGKFEAAYCLVDVLTETQVSIRAEMPQSDPRTLGDIDGSTIQFLRSSFCTPSHQLQLF
jgi:hypothetical protein